MKSVAELMTPNPTTIEPEASALAALDVMVDAGIRHLPVVDRRAGLVGIVSVDDLRAALPFAVSLRHPPSPDEREIARELSVAEVMTHGPLVARPQTRVSEAAATLARFRIGCLPVVEAGRLVGILSETDVLRAIATQGTDAGAADAAGADARKRELEILVTELRAERTRILRQLGRVQEIELEATREEREIPLDDADRAAHAAQLAVDGPLAALATRRLAALDHALFRASQGRLGACEKCGKPISVARLRALPGAVSCVRCARTAAAS